MTHIIKGKKITWVEIKNPKEKDIDWLRDKYHLHPLVLKDLLPPLDHPKIENFGDYLFLVIFYPFFDRKTSQTTPFELDVIISKDYVITSHYKDIVPLKAIFDKCNLYEDVREEYFDEGTQEVLFRILREILKACMPKLSHIKQHIDTIEEAIYKKQNKETVAEISLVNRDIIGFQRIIEPQKLVFKELAEESEKFFGKNSLPYFNNIVNLHNQVRGILMSHNKALTGLESTNQSLLTTRTNEIIKILTIFSVVVFPLTLFASIFGMNTQFLPFVGSRYDFWIIVGIMLIATAVMLSFFKNKKWL